MEQVVFSSRSHFFGKNPKLACFEMELLVLKVLKLNLFSKGPFSWGFGLFWGFFAVQMLQMALAKAKQNNRTGSREILLGQTGECGPALPRIPGHFCSSCKVQCNHRAEKMILLQEDP